MMELSTVRPPNLISNTAKGRSLEMQPVILIIVLQDDHPEQDFNQTGLRTNHAVSRSATLNEASLDAEVYVWLLCSAGGQKHGSWAPWLLRRYPRAMQTFQVTGLNQKMAKLSMNFPPRRNREA